MRLKRHDLSVVVQLLGDILAHPQFLLEPQRHRLDERADSVGRVGHVRFQKPLELDQRFVVENDVVQVPDVF